MKKTLSIVLVLALMISMCVPVFATQGTQEVTITYRQIKVIVNGKEITPCDGNGNPTEPFIMNSTTYLPVRAVANALGLSAGWDAKTNTISLISGSSYNYGSGEPAASSETRTEKITYRDISIYLDKAEVVTAAEPFIMNSNSTTYLPLRAVASALGLNVAWDSATSTVTLTSIEENPTEPEDKPGSSDETKPDPAPEEGNTSTVYITPTGKRYHELASCAGKNAIAIELGDAIARGYTPCKTCAE